MFVFCVDFCRFEFDCDFPWRTVNVYQRVIQESSGSIVSYNDLIASRDVIGRGRAAWTIGGRKKLETRNPTADPSKAFRVQAANRNSGISTWSTTWHQVRYHIDWSWIIKTATTANLRKIRQMFNKKFQLSTTRSAIRLKVQAASSFEAIAMEDSPDPASPQHRHEHPWTIQKSEVLCHTAIPGELVYLNV